MWKGKHDAIPVVDITVTFVVKCLHNLTVQKRKGTKVFGVMW